MDISQISVPEIYKTSADFRFFLKWFELCLSKIQYETENIDQLYDPLRCPSWLLWLLADTMGFKYDDRVPIAENRLILMYFMSMIRNKGSKDGVTLAAEVNLAQFNIRDYGVEDPILNDRLEDTSIPVNSVFVQPHVEKGYIDVVYFATEVPVDACIEYVRPLGMYMIPHAGVRLDGRTKVSIDARLTNTNDLDISIGPTHVGHYSREDYARIQKLREDDLVAAVVATKAAQAAAQSTGYSATMSASDKVITNTVGKLKMTSSGTANLDTSQVEEKALSDVQSDETVLNLHVRDAEGLTREQREAGEEPDHLSHRRRPVWGPNRDYEKDPDLSRNPGYRALYSLQLSNNEHIFNALISKEDSTLGKKVPIFGLGYEPQDVDVRFPEDYVLPSMERDVEKTSEFHIGHIRPWNLRYDNKHEEEASVNTDAPDVWTIEKQPYGSGRTAPHMVNKPKPRVNPPMAAFGDAMPTNRDNTRYMMKTDTTIGHGFFKAEKDSEITDEVTDTSQEKDGDIDPD